MTAEYDLLKFVQRLANATEYSSYDTGRVIVAEWKEDARELLERHHLMVPRAEALKD